MEDQSAFHTKMIYSIKHDLVSKFTPYRIVEKSLQNKYKNQFAKYLENTYIETFRTVTSNAA